MLRPVEIEEVLKWEDNEVTRYAIKQAVLMVLIVQIY